VQEGGGQREWVHVTSIVHLAVIISISYQPAICSLSGELPI